jgi:DNA replication protein DnaC
MNSLCQRLNLTSVLAVLPQLLDDARQQQLSYEALLERVLSVELDGRQQRAHARRVRAAKLPLPARIESFDFRFQPSISERRIGELASLTFLQTATNVLLLGPPGVGKTQPAICPPRE